ncbi:MAG: mannose-1-phosphate guanylyltransferase [Bdellovibrionales bacterium]|nr:mannose-1-phosphate guanylyltransferase [Bdellovibrionales bacterium]
MSNLFVGQLSSDAAAVAVIMAGGSGTRFWPASRNSFPKQFLSLAGSDRSLIQATSDRLRPLVGADGTMVVTSRSQMQLVREHLPDVAVLAEPIARNTAPCVGYAALRVLESVGDVPMIVLPADHYIREEQGLLEVCRRGAELARRRDVLITIGIPPSSPETGYGYIQAGPPLTSEDRSVLSVSRFVEKPDRATAETYLASGDYFWNSGMFIWRPSVVLSAISQHLPELAKSLEKIRHCMGSGSPESEIEAEFASIGPVSIDVGVMEKAENVAMMPGTSFSWSDIGSWDAWGDLMRRSGSDEQGNVLSGDVLAIDCNNLVAVAKERLIAAVGLNDVIIVEAGDAILVCPSSRAQDVKRIVEEIKRAGRQELL